MAESSAPGGGAAHRGRLLELDLDAAAGGVFDGLLGLVVEAVLPQAATGRSQGIEMGAGARAIHQSDIMCDRADGREGGPCVYVCLRAELGSGRTEEGNAREGTKEGMCSPSREWAC